mmetsp:Transcript_17452/g.29369  ORF Transcript_17452/g.29369 Transcript_17452/m.29369 type:complete len:216 (-) Transcript_17452:471-1118(-)
MGLTTSHKMCWISTPLCTSCQSDVSIKKFDCSADAGCEASTFNDTLSMHGMTVKGFNSTARFCLDSGASKCTGNNFRFLPADSASNSSSLITSGLCGIGPNPADGESSSLIKALFSSRAIDSRQLTMILSDSAASSYLEFGTPTSPASEFFFANVGFDSQGWFTTFIDSSLSSQNTFTITINPIEPTIFVPDDDLIDITEFINLNGQSVSCEIKE